MKVYIAGPINGYPDGNRAMFEKVAGQLRDLGHEPVNPHDIGPLEHAEGAHVGDPVEHSEHGYGCFMIPDIGALLQCEGFTLLSEWTDSRGARVERDVAIICGKEFVRTTPSSVRRPYHRIGSKPWA